MNRGYGGRASSFQKVILGEITNRITGIISYPCSLVLGSPKSQLPPIDHGSARITASVGLVVLLRFCENAYCIMNYEILQQTCVYGQSKQIDVGIYQ
jgi:hypothetical protein